MSNVVVVDPTSPPPPKSYSRDLALWFGLLGPPTAWFAHLSLMYVFVGVYCKHGIAWPLYASSIGCGLAAIATGAWGWSRRAPEDRPGFMASLGPGNSALFTTAIIAQTIAMYFFSPCWS